MSYNVTHTIHIVVPSSGSSSPSASKARFSSSSTSSMEVTPSMGSSPYGVISPVVTIVSSALAWQWPHYAWSSTSTGVERWSVVVRGRGVVEARRTGRVVGWVATIHRHLHVHVHVVHIIHVRTVAQQTLVNYRQQQQKEKQVEQQ